MEKNNFIFIGINFFFAFGIDLSCLLKTKTTMLYHVSFGLFFVFLSFYMMHPTCNDILIILEGNFLFVPSPFLIVLHCLLEFSCPSSRAHVSDNCLTPGCYIRKQNKAHSCNDSKAINNTFPIKSPQSRMRKWTPHFLAKFVVTKMMIAAGLMG